MKRKRNSVLSDIRNSLRGLERLSEEEKINTINKIKKIISEKYSPFKNEPVDCVIWEKLENVTANDYNPNSVAPPEMELLETSIMHDGYTQPVVTWSRSENEREVVDGFHRNRVARESEVVKNRIKGYIPVVTIRSEQTDRNDRIASTIRHNRARGKHNVESMSDIVIELKKRNWSDSRIAKELGMDQDEILRLCQMTGLTDVFADVNFSQAWIAGNTSDDDLNLIDEFDIESEAKENDRILHQWDKWECYPAGFYEQHPPKGMTVEECEIVYKELLTDTKEFRKALYDVLRDWKHSCEHYLTNSSMNRIAWLCQAALCIKYNIPSRFRGGYNLLTDEQKLKADETALKALNRWLRRNDRDPVDLEKAGSKALVNLY